MWRRGGDLNPGYLKIRYNRLAICRFRPLSHLSASDRRLGRTALSAASTAVLKLPGIVAESTPFARSDNARSDTWRTGARRSFWFDGLTSECYDPPPSLDGRALLASNEFPQLRFGDAPLRPRITPVVGDVPSVRLRFRVA